MIPSLEMNSIIREPVMPRIGWFLLPVILLAMGTGIRAQDDPYLSGRAYMAMGKYDSAVVHLSKALELEPGIAQTLYQLGICHFETNNNPAAREALYEAGKRKKGLGSLYLAKTEVRLNHPELALKYLRDHLSSRYKVQEKVILLDKELSTLEETKGWQQLWNEKKWYNQSDQEYQEAVFLKENGDALEAINILNNLEKKGYRRSMVQAEKASIYAELGNHKAARSALQSAVKSDTRNLDALYNLAEYQVAGGDIEEALKALDRLIRQDPARFEAYLLRARTRSENGDLPGALEDVDLYLAYFPGNHQARYQRGMVQFNHGKYLGAIQDFNRALELENGNAAYYFARGRTYAATGTTRYADRDMAMALDLDPLNGEIWFEKAKLSEQLGNRDNACHCYRKAFQFGIFEAGQIIEKRCN